MSRDRLVERQMETPTLDQVKEYFKDAKKVKCVVDNSICNVIVSDFAIRKDYCVQGYETNGLDHCILWNKNNGYSEIVEYKSKLTKDVPNVLTKDALRSITEPKHYDNTNGSLYKFCEDKELNSYEFDIIKRVMRCRKKGVFLEDLQKTKVLIDLYIKENEDN